MLLSKRHVKRELKSLHDWKLGPGGRSIVREQTFPTFMQGIEFVNKVARLAEERVHHPDISVRYTKIKLFLTTHDEGGLTERDFDLAKKIDVLLESPL